MLRSPWEVFTESVQAIEMRERPNDGEIRSVRQADFHSTCMAFVLKGATMKKRLLGSCVQNDSG